MPIPLRSDFTAAQVRAAATTTKDGPQARHLFARAAIYDIGARDETVRVGGVTLRIVRDWMPRFNVDGATGLLD